MSSGESEVSFRSGMELNNYGHSRLGLIPVTELDGLWRFVEFCNSVMFRYEIKQSKNLGVLNLPVGGISMRDVRGVEIVDYNGSPVIIDESLQDAFSQPVPDIIMNLPADCIAITASRKILVLQVHYFIR